MNTLNTLNTFRHRTINRKSKDFLIEEALVALLLHGGYDWASDVVEFLHCRAIPGKYQGTYLSRANAFGYQHILDETFKGGKKLSETSKDELLLHIAYATHKKMISPFHNHDQTRLLIIDQKIMNNEISDLCEWSQRWIEIQREQNSIYFQNLNIEEEK